MKIKDLSSSNSASGEGILRWPFQGTNGKTISIKVVGYHIPTAEVRLLSPQVLLQTVGGHAFQTVQWIDFTLDNGFQMVAKFCPQSNLPLLSLAPPYQEIFSFWDEAFGYSITNLQAINKIRSILGAENTNLSSSQKELLLWHQKLSHALLNWVQMLMRNRKWLKSQSNDDEALYSGPFIRIKSRAPVCDIAHLKCAACLCAKASRKTPSNLPARPLTKDLILKRGHLMPGDCISVDHFFSPVKGHLLHTYGHETKGYTCGSLFVDHASGKIFIFHSSLLTLQKQLRALFI